MTRTELLLGLLRIAHSQRPDDGVSINIAERWLARFDELGLGGEEKGAERAAPAAPKPTKPAR